MSVSHSIPSSDRRWLKVLVAGAALVTVTFGIRQVFGLFVVPISTELGGGVQTIALAIAVQNLIWGFSSPVFGAMADRIGAWKVAILGAAIYTAGLLSTAYIVSPGGVFLGQALIGLGLGSAGISIALGAVGRVVPPGRRSIAFGLVTSFGSFGQFALLPVTQMMIGTYGWQQALVVLSFLMAAMTAMALGMRSDQQAKTAEVARELSTGEALRVAVRSRDYLLLTAGFFVCGLQLVFITTHLPVFLFDNGVDAEIASWSLALVGLFNIVGAFVCGWLGSNCQTQDAGDGLSSSRRHHVRLLPAAGDTGIGADLRSDDGASLAWHHPADKRLIVTFFGPKHLSMLYGIAFTSHQIGSFVGSWLGGVVYDMTASYTIMWWLNVGAALFAFGVNWIIREAPVDTPRPSRQPPDGSHLTCETIQACSPSQRSASRAAMQPMPAAVTA